jgi:hypothetical protein
MKIKFRARMIRTVKFKSSFVNEWRFDASGNPVAPGARELADRIASKIAERASVVRPIRQHSYYGWAFDVRYDNCRFINVLNPASDENYLSIKLGFYWLRWLLTRHSRQKLDEYCLVVKQALAAIPQISNVVWLA